MCCRKEDKFYDAFWHEQKKKMKVLIKQINNLSILQFYKWSEIFCCCCFLFDDCVFQMRVKVNHIEIPLELVLAFYLDQYNK